MSDPRQALHDRVSNDYAARPPRDAEVKALIDTVAADIEHVAHKLIDSCPLGRELSLALTDLESAKRNAVAAIVLHQDDIHNA